MSTLPLIALAQLLFAAAILIALTVTRRLMADVDKKDGRGAFFAIAEFDRFAALRATVGSDVANAVLAVAGERIRDSFDRARLHRTGQCNVEFSFRAVDEGEARRQLAACLDTLEGKITAHGMEFRLRARVAVSPLPPGDPQVSDSLIDSVIVALSRESTERVRLAGEVGRGPSLVNDLDVLRALPQAITDSELALHYQPKFDCRGAGGITSAEALLRWNSPTLGPVQVDQIIRLAERTGMIGDLTVWVLNQAARDQAALRAAGHELTIFVNISGVLIPHRRFMLDVLRLVRQAPGTIGIEITETAVIDDPEAAIENIAAFSAAGIPVAIDDFGTGLSSLSYLKQLPADELKIDREFVMGLTRSHRDPLIVRASIDLAHALEMKVTAEGVDDAMSLSLLRVMGCDMLQGYFISRPVPLPKLIAFLESDQPHLSVEEAAPSWSRRASGIAPK